MKKLTQREKLYCLLTLIPVLAVMATIFYFSSQTAEASTATSGGFVEAVMKYITVHFGEISSDAYSSIENTVTFIVRKAAHFLEFAALGFFAETHLVTFIRRRTWLIAPLFSMLYAVSDEFHQKFVSERAPRFLDVCVDSAGAICGTAAACLLIFIIKKTVEKRRNRNGKEKEI